MVDICVFKITHMNTYDEHMNVLLNREHMIIISMNRVNIDYGGNMCFH